MNVTANAVFGQNGSFTNNLLLATGAERARHAIGVSFDDAGNLYAADQGNARVLEFFTPLTVTATAGSGDTNADVLWGQGGDMVAAIAMSARQSERRDSMRSDSVAVDSAGNVYISDTGNNRITAYSPPFPPPGADIGDDSPGVLKSSPLRSSSRATGSVSIAVRNVTLTNRGPSADHRSDDLSAIGDFTFLERVPDATAPGSQLRNSGNLCAGGRRPARRSNRDRRRRAR